MGFCSQYGILIISFSTGPRTYSLPQQFRKIQTLQVFTPYSSSYYELRGSILSTCHCSIWIPSLHSLPSLESWDLVQSPKLFPKFETVISNAQTNPIQSLRGSHLSMTIWPVSDRWDICTCADSGPHREVRCRCDRGGIIARASYS